MLIRNATENDIRKALAIANEEFEDNLKFKRLDAAGRTRSGDPKFTVTLTVKNSRELGGRRAYSGRRIAAACWHSHGVFMDALPEECEIVTTIGRNRETKRPGAPWQDANIGSMMYPLYFSEACECKDSFW